MVSVPTEVDLLNLGKISSVIAIAASILFLLSANESLAIEYAKIRQEPPPEFKIPPSEVSVAAFFISFINCLISYKISVARYEQLIEKQAQGDTTVNITPNIKFVIAAGLSLISAALAYVAAQEKLKAEAQIIISR